jgi:acyl-CoA reductase-like NAD-dependent aldehyde dehydrogenase
MLTHISLVTTVLLSFHSSFIQFLYDDDCDAYLYVAGENVDAFFSRVAALAFEKAVIREAEDDTTDTGAVADSDQIITISKRDSHINGTSGSEGTKCCK